MNARAMLAAVLGTAAFLAIALAGGGWLALGRVDPLLALPGAGWAAAIAMAIARAPRSAAIALVASAALILIAACLHAGAPPPLAPLLITLLGLALAALLAAAALALVRRALAHRPRMRRVALALGVMTLGVGWQLAAWRVVPLLYAPQIADRPRVTMLTSLPLFPVEGIGAQLAGQGTTAPMLDLLRLHARLTVADSVDAAMLARTDALLLAHPRLLAPLELVAIDDWVRRGGRVLILADGLLTWPPPYGLGDPRNPPVSSMLGPLLTHWGLRLDAPSHHHREERVLRDGQRLHLLSAGRFVALPGGRCQVAGPVADCAIGAGRALLLADADLLHASLWQGDARNGPAAWSSDNAAWIIDRLHDLAESPHPPSMARPIWTAAGVRPPTNAPAATK